MLFNSFPFLLIFMPVALIGYYALARVGPRIAAGWLVATSLAFYAYWNITFVAFLLGSITFNYALARGIFATDKRPKLQRLLLAGGVGGDITVLVYYKYLFAILSFLRVQTGIDIPFSEVILPLGISFFTFTQIGYLVDIKQGLAKDRDLLDYILFVTFFPHLIAGPILHNREMMPQFAHPETYKFSSDSFAIGITIFAIGLFKKVIIADYLSTAVEDGFSISATAEMSQAWHSAIAYTFQLYFDFSGYSDMAIGLARMFNIRFPLNFNSPFKATSIIDFWQRFHMSLTRFTTMYVFSPIALRATRWWMDHNPNVQVRPNATIGGYFLLVFMPTIVTMTVLGVWHGAGLQFLIFGLLHGVYISINHAMRIFFPERPFRTRFGSVASHAAKVGATTLAVLVALVFFRSTSVTMAFDILEGMLGLHGMASPTGNSWLIKYAMIYIFLWFAPNTQQIMCNYQPALGKAATNSISWLIWSPRLHWMVGASLLLSVSIARLSSHSEFLYFQF